VSKKQTHQGSDGPAVHRTIFKAIDAGRFTKGRGGIKHFQKTLKEIRTATKGDHNEDVLWSYDRKHWKNWNQCHICKKYFKNFEFRSHMKRIIVVDGQKKCPFTRERIVVDKEKVLNDWEQRKANELKMALAELE